MFETVGTVLGEYNIVGTGIFIFIALIILAISRGLTKDKKELITYFILFGTFTIILLFRDDIIKTYVFVTTAIAVIIYGLSYFHKARGEE